MFIAEGHRPGEVLDAVEGPKESGVVTCKFSSHLFSLAEKELSKPL